MFVEICIWLRQQEWFDFMRICINCNNWYEHGLCISRSRVTYLTLFSFLFFCKDLTNTFSDVKKHENVGRGTSAEKRQNWRSQKRNKVDIMQHMIAPGITPYQLSIFIQAQKQLLFFYIIRFFYTSVSH